MSNNIINGLNIDLVGVSLLVTEYEFKKRCIEYMNERDKTNYKFDHFKLEKISYPNNDSDPVLVPNSRSFSHIDFSKCSSIGQNDYIEYEELCKIMCGILGLNDPLEVSLTVLYDNRVEIWIEKSIYDHYFK